MVGLIVPANPPLAPPIIVMSGLIVGAKGCGIGILGVMGCGIGTGLGLGLGVMGGVMGGIAGGMGATGLGIGGKISIVSLPNLSIDIKSCLLGPDGSLSNGLSIDGGLEPLIVPSGFFIPPIDGGFCMPIIPKSSGNGGIIPGP